MKTLKLALILTFLCGISHADVINIPFSCYPEQIKQDFAESGLKIEADSTIRGEDTWGFIVNKGSSYDVVKYGSMTDEEFDLINRIIWET